MTKVVRVVSDRSTVLKKRDDRTKTYLPYLHCLKIPNILPATRESQTVTYGGMRSMKPSSRVSEVVPFNAFRLINVSSIKLEQ